MAGAAAAAAVVLFPVLLVGAGGEGDEREGDDVGVDASSSGSSNNASLLSSALAYDDTTAHVPMCSTFVEVVSRSFPVAFVQASLVYYVVAVFLHYVVPWVLAGRVALASVQKGRREAGQVRREAVASLVRCCCCMGGVFYGRGAKTLPFFFFFFFFFASVLLLLTVPSTTTTTAGAADGEEFDMERGGLVGGGRGAGVRAGVGRVGDGVWRRGRGVRVGDCRDGVGFGSVARCVVLLDASVAAYEIAVSVGALRASPESVRVVGRVTGWIHPGSEGDHAMLWVTENGVGSARERSDRMLLHKKATPREGDGVDSPRERSDRMLLHKNTPWGYERGG